MSKAILLVNANIINEGKNFPGNISITNGIIEKVIPGIDINANDFRSSQIIDLKGKYILPGAIDPHTHIAMPFMGTHAQDDYETGTIAAACGGVTSLVDFDLQQKGETLLEALERKKALADGKVAIDYSLHPAVMDPRPDVIEEVKKACL